MTATCVAIGVPLGLVLARTDLRLRRVALWLHTFPLFLPPFLLALGWFHLFGRAGLAGSPATARLLFSPAGALAVLVLALTPVVTALAAVALRGVDPSLEEAARLVAGPRRIATGILLPLIRPAIALAALVVFSLAFSERGVPMFLRVSVYPGMVFSRLGGVDYAPGEAFALALPLVAVAFALLAFERKAAGRRSLAVLGLRTGELDVLPLGRWRMLAASFAAVAALVPLAPLCALATRAIAGNGFAGLPSWIGPSVWNSLFDAFAAATAVLVVAVFIGHAAARGRPGGASLDAVAVLAFVTPASVVGVGLIAAWNRPSLQARVGAPLPEGRVSTSIELENVTVLRGGRRVLEGVSLRVAAGETLTILGGSGSGKTTLLRAVAGFVMPERGRIRLGDLLASGEGRPLIAPEERGIAMVFQDLALWPHLTVEGNLSFGLAARKVPRRERRDRIAAMLTRVGLSGKEGRHPGDLSGGERQRVAIARALVLEPRAVLFDEPLSNLDAPLKRELLALFRELLVERRTTTLYVTHDPREALALAARAAVLEEGRLAYLGPLEGLRDRPAGSFPDPSRRV